MSDTLTLNIPIDDKTRRKLGALAVLNGQKPNDIQKELEDIFAAEAGPFLDNFLSYRISATMAELNGEDAPQFKMGAGLHQEEEKTEPVDDIAGHSLSGEEDDGAPSLEEQMNISPQSAQRPVLVQSTSQEAYIPPEVDVEDVGNNADAFLDSAFEAPKQEVRRPRASASGGFNPRKSRVKISDYTTNEAEESLF